jgi:hypothetical protein
MRAAVRVLAGSVVLLTACQDLSEPTGPQATPQYAQASAAASGMADQALIARAVPAFGGMFIDRGVPTVYVTDMAEAGEARRNAARLATQHGFGAEEIVVVQGRFSFAQLNEGLERATHAALPLAGAVFADLDEARNRVVVGVENEGLLTAFSRVLENAGLAAGSYEVIVTPAIRHAATLRDRHDPMVGGIQLHFSQYVCTLGANVLDGSERSFITNSHCTATQGGVENTAYYQPASSTDGAAVATEVEDPTYWKGGACPRGKKCRYSDSSRARYTSARGSAFAIATTTGANNGSLTIAGSVNVVGKSNNVVVGTTVNKVGRTTGWTRGTVSRTCVNTGVQGSQVVQLCQHFVQANSTIVGSGDSGSSVWTGSGSATLVGLLWGGSSDGRTFIFSPIGQIEQELGALTVN